MLTYTVVTGLPFSRDFCHPRVRAAKAQQGQVGLKMSTTVEIDFAPALAQPLKIFTAGKATRAKKFKLYFIYEILYVVQAQCPPTAKFRGLKFVGRFKFPVRSS